MVNDELPLEEKQRIVIQSQLDLRAQEAEAEEKVGEGTKRIRESRNGWGSRPKVPCGECAPPYCSLVERHFGRLLVHLGCEA